MKKALRSSQYSPRASAPSYARQAGMWRARLGLRIYTSLLLGVLAVALLASPESYSPRVDAQSGRARYQQDLAQVFNSYEEVQLDPRAAADDVKRSGHLSVESPAHHFEIDLTPNDLRAPNYHAEEVVDG